MLTRLRAGGSDSRLHASSALGGEERGLGSCSPDRPRKSSSPFPAAASAVAAAAAAEAAAKVKSPSASLLPGAAADLGCGISLQQCGKLGFCTSEQLLCPLLEAPLFCPQQKNKKGKLEGAFFPFHFHFSSSSVQFPTLPPSRRNNNIWGPPSSPSGLPPQSCEENEMVLYIRENEGIEHLLPYTPLPVPHCCKISLPEKPTTEQRL